MSVTRLITPGDAPALAELVRVNRDFLAPWEPARGEDYYTADGQRAHIENVLAGYQQGTHLPLVILSDAGRVAGRVNLSSIVRGAAQSGSVGYWLGAADSGGRTRPSGWPRPHPARQPIKGGGPGPVSSLPSGRQFTARSLILAAGIGFIPEPDPGVQIPEHLLGQ